MYLLGEKQEQTDNILLRVKKISEHLFADVPPPSEQVVLPNITNLYEQFDSDSLYIIAEGSVAATFENKTTIIYEPGDLIGLSHCYKLPTPKFYSDEPTVLNRYDATTLLRFFTETKEKQSIWSSYLITLNAAFIDAYGQLAKQQATPNTGFIDFNKGDVIIRQGDVATDVYSIITGSAEVYVDDKKVGDVFQDELFGAMAIFTGTKRSASVVAAEHCSVLSVPKEEFVALMHSQPETMVTLITNMARCITALNSRVTDQSEAEQIV